MKVKEEINLKKAELEKLKKEVEFYENIIKFNIAADCKDKIDISKVKVCEMDKIKYFVKEAMTTHGFLGYFDIFSGKYVSGIPIEPIIKVYPELLAYIDNKVPRLILQRLYYEANKVDGKVLKKFINDKNSMN